MRTKTVLNLFFALFITLSSCTKDAQTPNEPLQYSQSLFGGNIKVVIEQKDMHKLKQMHIMLSDQERKQLWTKKYSEILKNDAALLSSEQKTVIQELLQILSEDNKDVSAHYYRSNLNRFHELFTNEQFIMLSVCPFYCDNFSIFKSEEYFDYLDNTTKNMKTTYVNPIEDGAADCECQINADCSKKTPTCKKPKNPCKTTICYIWPTGFAEYCDGFCNK